MLILAFDTTQEYGGAGIFRDSECLAFAPHVGPKDYSMTLFQQVQEILRNAGVRLEDIDLYAVATGPGSFTGIRVGIAAARGWESVFRRPVRGVSVFDAMVEEAGPETRFAAALIDASRGEVYAGMSRQGASGEAFQPITEGFVLKPHEIADFVALHVGPTESLACITREGDDAARRLQPFLAASRTWRSVTNFLVPAIARVALRSYKEKGPQRDLAAYYIRRPDAELKWKE